MKSYICSLITTSLLATSLGAVNLENSVDPSIFFLGSKSGNVRDFVCQGMVNDCQFNDGVFLVSYNDISELSSFYLDQPRSEYSFSDDGRFCNILLSDANVLEVGYDDSGIINTFAANVLQNSESATSWPTFIAVRYNSDIPVEANTKELYGYLHEPASFFYAINRHKIVNGYQFSPAKHFDFARSGLLPKEVIDKIERIGNDKYYTERLVITANVNASSVEDYSIGDEENVAFIYFPAYSCVPPNSIFPVDSDDVSMLVVAIGGVKNHSILTFSTTNPFGFDFGHRGKSSGSDGINFVELECSKIYLIKEYIVRELEVDAFGRVIHLAIDYIAEADDGSISEGSIRHNSHVYVDFSNPYHPDAVVPIDVRIPYNP